MSEFITRSQLDTIHDAIFPDVYRRLVRIERYIFGSEGADHGGVPSPDDQPKPSGGPSADLESRLRAVQDRLDQFTEDVDARLRESESVSAKRFRELVEIVAELRRSTMELREAVIAAEKVRHAGVAAADVPDYEPA